MKFISRNLILLMLCFIAYAEHQNNTQNDEGVPNKIKKNDLKEVESDEEDELLLMRNVDNEINTRERLQINDKLEDKKAQKDFSVPATPGCSVLRSGIIDVEIDPSDVLKTQKFNLTLSSDSLILNYIGSSPVQLYKKFSLPAIQMPLETLDRARDCFRMYYKGVPHVLCGSNTTQRDDWAAAIIEAVFCFNSGVASKKVTENLEKGKDVKLPEKSTKEIRWKNLEEQREKERQKDESEANTENEKLKGEEVAEIEISGILSGNPKVTVNGEELPFSAALKVEEEEQMQQLEF